MPSSKRFPTPLRKSEKKGTGTLPGLNPRFNINNEKFRTAQLHIHRNSFIQSYTGTERIPEKKEGMLRLLSIPASLTVEAALVLPVFVAAMCILMFPLRVMEAEMDAQMKMEQMTEILSLAEGVRRSTGEISQESRQITEKELGQLETGTEESQLQLPSLFGAAELLAGGVTVLTALDENVFFGQEIPTVELPSEEKPMVRLQVLGFVRYPFFGFLSSEQNTGIAQGLLSPVRLISSRRAWVGRKGGSGRAFAGTAPSSGEETEEEERIVFVARNSIRSGRYHVDSNCHYISNGMRMISIEQIRKLRNKNGGKYHPCPSCNAEGCSQAYIFNSGDAYHSSEYCKAIQSYAVEMKESEARGRGLTPCHTCGRKQ